MNILNIIDFGDKKVFDNADIYTCIITCTKAQQNTIKYIKPTINNTLIAVKGCIATLNDKIFIHNNRLYNEPCWKYIYKISKDIIQWCIYPYDSK